MRGLFRGRFMSVTYFEDERREMIAAIRVIAEHLADEARQR